ncbi:Fatty acid hydroxylase [Mycena indigotica]|uniref:Fatty acid hydroxylase n=1 Tax=Mycena indigotica TaxID=2126181 RepID=A0A8H6W767_9AGAR|nr:Fatty acid hydroxylase [Mycena indigotica]KAF7301809.1 Fatty acid hydroxylase [Mycena indigotica]
MDFVLDLCDTYFLDAVYAKIIPLDATRSLNASVTAVLPASSQWSKIMSDLPLSSIMVDDTPASPSSISHPIYASAWPRDYIPRQVLSLSVLTLIGIHLLYFIFAGLSYRYIFNHEMRKHPRFLPQQEKLEIQSSLRAFPMITLLTLPWFLGEVRGYSKLYDGADSYGYLYLFASAPFFLLFTDYCIYWVHRWLHIPFFYKALHKPHHKWIIPTPWAACRIIFFVFIFPLHRLLYLGLFVFVNFWSIFIHDSDMITGHPLEKVINGPAHHTLHHLYFTCNYGQYFTWADRAGSSYRQPESSLDPMLEVKALQKSKAE